MDWHDKVVWLYDCIYEGNGGMGRLAKDIGVSRLSVQFWYHYPNKLNPDTGKPVEPSYWNRVSIDGLYEDKTKPKKVVDADSVVVVE